MSRESGWEPAYRPLPEVRQKRLMQMWREYIATVGGLEGYRFLGQSQGDSDDKELRLMLIRDFNEKHGITGPGAEKIEEVGKKMRKGR